MSSILIHAWVLQKHNNEYYIPYTQWIYLETITRMYDRVVLLCPTKYKVKALNNGYSSLKKFNNIEVYELPYSITYKDAIKNFFHYLKAYKKIKNIDVYYSRYPTPFGWLQMFFGNKHSKKIIHYVGDTIETVIENKQIDLIKKVFLILFFLPEHILFLLASSRAVVYTNGFKIHNKLKKIFIKSQPVISSTLSDFDFNRSVPNVINESNLNFVYVGFIRKAKGVDVLIKGFEMINKKYPNSTLKIVGKGEVEDDIKNYVIENKIANVNFLGHIDNREQLLSILRASNIFAFASLSEGSPRVILEAMANKLLVISTPVGSLPYIFKNEENILFFDFDSPDQFYNQVIRLVNNDFDYNTMINKSFEISEKFTVSNFVKKIFNSDVK